MAVRDPHSVCLECLTATHVPTQCRLCTDIPFTLLQVRYGLMGDALQQSKWPSDWRITLARAEQAVWAGPDHNSPTPSEEEEEEEEETNPKLIVDPRTQVVSPKQNQSQNQGGSPDSTWKSGVDKSISGLADSLKLINESLNSLVGSKAKKRKSKPTTQVTKKKIKIWKTGRARLGSGQSKGWLFK